MIIPPDPEKDPNVFSPSSSTQSLLPPPSESSDIDSITHPERAYIRNPVFGYPFSDDLGVGYNGEALPPYQQHHHRGDGSDLNAPGNPPMRERSRVSRIPPGIIIPDRPMERERGIKSSLDDGDADEDITPRASTSTAQLPFTSLNTPSTTIGSTSKLWESSSFSNKKKGKGKMREWLIPPVTISPKYKRWWKKWRKWVYVILGLVLTGLGLMVGLLVGLRTGLEEEKNKGDSSTWKDISGDGKRQNWVSVSTPIAIDYDTLG